MDKNSNGHCSETVSLISDPNVTEQKGNELPVSESNRKYRKYKELLHILSNFQKNKKKHSGDEDESTYASTLSKTANTFSNSKEHTSNEVHPVFLNSNYVPLTETPCIDRIRGTSNPDSQEENSFDSIVLDFKVHYEKPMPSKNFSSSAVTKNSSKYSSAFNDKAENGGPAFKKCPTFEEFKMFQIQQSKSENNTGNQDIHVPQKEVTIMPLTVPTCITNLSSDKIRPASFSEYVPEDTSADTDVLFCGVGKCSETASESSKNEPNSVNELEDIPEIITTDDATSCETTNHSGTLCASKTTEIDHNFVNKPKHVSEGTSLYIDDSSCEIINYKKKVPASETDKAETCTLIGDIHGTECITIYTDDDDDCWITKDLGRIYEDSSYKITEDDRTLSGFEMVKSESNSVSVHETQHTHTNTDNSFCVVTEYSRNHISACLASENGSSSLNGLGPECMNVYTTDDIPCGITTENKNPLFASQTDKNELNSVNVHGSERTDNYINDDPVCLVTKCNGSPISGSKTPVGKSEQSLLDTHGFEYTSIYSEDESFSGITRDKRNYFSESYSLSEHRSESTNSVGNYYAGIRKDPVSASQIVHPVGESECTNRFIDETPQITGYPRSPLSDSQTCENVLDFSNEHIKEFTHKRTYTDDDSSSVITKHSKTSLCASEVLENESRSSNGHVLKCNSINIDDSCTVCASQILPSNNDLVFSEGSATQPDDTVYAHDDTKKASDIQDSSYFCRSLIKSECSSMNPKMSPECIPTGSDHIFLETWRNVQNKFEKEPVTLVSSKNGYHNSNAPKSSVISIDENSTFPTSLIHGIDNSLYEHEPRDICNSPKSNLSKVIESEKTNQQDTISKRFKQKRAECRNKDLANNMNSSNKKDSTNNSNKLQKMRHSEEGKDIEDPRWNDFRTVQCENDLYKHIRGFWKGKDCYNPKVNLSASNYRYKRIKKTKSCNNKEQVVAVKRKAINTDQVHPNKVRKLYPATFLEDFELTRLRQELKTKKDEIKYEHKIRRQQLLQKHTNLVSKLKKQIEETVLREKDTVNCYTDNIIRDAVEALDNYLLVSYDEIDRCKEDSLRNISNYYAEKIKRCLCCKSEMENIGIFYKNIGENFDATIMDDEELKEVLEVDCLLSMYEQIYR